MQLALYKGPPAGDWLHTLSHYATRLRTRSKYSHAELVIDNVCYTSSVRDGGVRSKTIDLTTGRWDIVQLTSSVAAKERAVAWFADHANDHYDFRNILRFIIPFVGHSKHRWVCFEAIGAALGIDKPHLLDADSLLQQALKL